MSQLFGVATDYLLKDEIEEVAFAEENFSEAVDEKGEEPMTVVCLMILAGIFWGDFFLKNYIESHVEEREEREICRGKLLIRKHHNKGMMLNAGQKRRRLVAVVSLAFTLVLTLVFVVSLGHRGNNLLRLGLSLLLGGAFSNTYDRLRRGYVVDYVSFPVKWQGFRKIVFNCSDFCIIIGAMISTLGMV